MADAYQKGDAAEVNRIQTEMWLFVASLPVGGVTGTIGKIEGIANATQKVLKVDELFAKEFDPIFITHTAGKQNGKLGEQLGLQLLNEQTGLDFKALQNASNHGCDGCAIAIKDNTIWVVDVKSEKGDRFI